MTRYTSLRRLSLAVVVLVALTGSCADSDDADATKGVPSPTDEQPSAASTSADNVESKPTSAPTSDEDAAETTPPDPVPLSETNQFNLLAPASYTTDALSLNLEFTTKSEFNVSTLLPGSIIIESPASAAGEFTGVGFFVVDTLVDSDTGARQRSRHQATVDLGDFLETRDGVAVTSSRDDQLGGRPTRVWRIEYSDPCTDCYFETLFGRTGWVNLWGTAPGQIQELWTIDVPGSPIIVAIEAPVDDFESWSELVEHDLFDELRFGPATGFSLQRPAGRFAAGFGEYAIGRIELRVDDTTRPTAEVRNDDGIVVPASDDRSLLLSIAYPSKDGGFGATPADGSFPLVVVAPALWDAAIILPADRQLASHGFVVAAIRFPESSFPGGAQLGVPQQPADVSFVIDELQRAGLPAELAAVTDIDTIGLIGHSGGATTALGLLAYQCCQDERLDAIVAHAGVTYDFESVRVPSSTPIMHVVSRGDLVAQVDAVREFHDMTDGPSAIAELDLDSHLGWLRPQANTYDSTFELVLAFLDRHLRTGQGDLASIAGDSAFVDYDEH